MGHGSVFEMESQLYVCTGGRGTEKFIASEIAEKVGARNVSANEESWTLHESDANEHLTS